ncbi:lysophospholipid acyltransferase family protein [soil metagenome]
MASARAKSNRALAVIRLILFSAACAAYLSVFVIRRTFIKSAKKRRALAMQTNHRWARAVCWLWGWRISVSGPEPPPGSLIAPNHCSYTDIMAIMAATPSFSMTRTEFMSWPLFGWILKTLDHPHVERKQTKDLVAVAEKTAERLREGFRLCVFLEGTSTAGDRVMPFHGPVVQGAIDAGAPIVPTAILWSGSQPGFLLGEDLAYWRDEHTLGPHVFRLLGMRGISARVTFGEPLATREGARKELTRVARDKVVAMTGLPALGLPDDHPYKLRQP